MMKVDCRNVNSPLPLAWGRDPQCPASSFVLPVVRKWPGGLHLACSTPFIHTSHRLVRGGTTRPPTALSPRVLCAFCRLSTPHPQHVCINLRVQLLPSTPALSLASIYRCSFTAVCLTSWWWPCTLALRSTMVPCQLAICSVHCHVFSSLRWAIGRREQREHVRKRQLAWGLDVRQRGKLNATHTHTQALATQDGHAKWMECSALGLRIGRLSSDLLDHMGAYVLSTLGLPGRSRLQPWLCWPVITCPYLGNRAGLTTPQQARVVPGSLLTCWLQNGTRT